MHAVLCFFNSRVERSSVYQRRSVRLPESADLDNINAKYENGVLSLDIPKVKVQILHQCIKRPIRIIDAGASAGILNFLALSSSIIYG